MALRLPKFQSGRPLLEEVTAEKLNQMVDAIAQCQINSGVGYDVSRGPGGATLTIRQDKAVMPTATGAPYVIGPVNTGIDASGGLLAAGTTALNWTVKKPGSSSFNPINVFGENNYYYEPYAISCSDVDLVYAKRSSGISLQSSDTSRFCGCLAAHQGSIYDYGPATSCNGNNGYDLGPCGNWGTITSYYPQGSSYSGSGAFGGDTDGCYNGQVPIGNYTFRCSFNIGAITPSSLKIRFRLRTQTSTGLVTSVLLNNVAASYSPSGSFSTDAGFNEIREISSGFQANQNTLDFVVNHSNSQFHPGIKCQFEPTTVLIVSKDGEETGGFSNLTTAQQDLLGQGTPVQVKISGTDKIYAYNGTGSKTSSGSYTYVRDG